MTFLSIEAKNEKKKEKKKTSKMCVFFEHFVYGK